MTAGSLGQAGRNLLGQRREGMGPFGLMFSIF
jgi:hypothetical protein